MFTGKKIILGVCGSIAAYKTAYLIRLFTQYGANIKVVMSKDATHFITPLTLSTLSKNPVWVDYFKPETGEWNNHVDLALWADFMLIAPASANTLAKLANGICDNILTAVYLSAKCPVYFAPAMDLDMWQHPATRENISKIITRNNLMIPPAHGELASGLVGEGRMAEPEEIISFVSNHLHRKLPLKGKKVLVTAGPTYENIDPVRFIGNYSSGKMGFALAEILSKNGASVTLISGPTALLLQDKRIQRVDVITAESMEKEVTQRFPDYDITIMSAAVADYKPQYPAQEKIKKDDSTLTIPLIKTTDILAALGKMKRANQLLIGFALETHNEEEHAVKKLKNKNLDFIVLNSLGDKNAGFKSDMNKITIIDKDLNKTYFDLKPKTEVAKDICLKIEELLS